MRVGRAKYPPYPVSFLSFCLFTSGKETKFDIHRSALLSNTEPVDEMRGHYCNKMAEVVSPCFFVWSAFTLDSNLVGAGSQRKLNKEGVVGRGGYNVSPVFSSLENTVTIDCTLGVNEKRHIMRLSLVQMIKNWHPIISCPDQSVLSLYLHNCRSEMPVLWCAQTAREREPGNESSAVFIPLPPAAWTSPPFPTPPTSTIAASFLQFLLSHLRMATV